MPSATVAVPVVAFSSNLSAVMKSTGSVILTPFFSALAIRSWTILDPSSSNREVPICRDTKNSTLSFHQAGQHIFATYVSTSSRESSFANSHVQARQDKAAVKPMYLLPEGHVSLIPASLLSLIRWIFFSGFVWMLLPEKRSFQKHLVVPY